jgi:hypothetical protein
VVRAVVKLGLITRPSCFASLAKACKISDTQPHEALSPNQAWRPHLQQVTDLVTWEKHCSRTSQISSQVGTLQKSRSKCDSPVGQGH